MDTFPETHTSEILSRLPIKSLVRKCKSWSNLTADPSFIDSHLNFSSQRNPNLTLIGTTCVDSTDFRNQIYYLENDENHYYKCVRVDFPIPGFQEFRIMGSCNGLLCLVHPRNRYIIYVYNPCIKEYIKLPEPISLSHQPADMVVGFGLSSRSNECKVLGIINYPGPSGIDVVRSEVYVYTLGDESWRLKENIPDLNLGQSASKAFVNGAVHWVSISPAKFIVSLDIDSEEFGVVPCPEFEFGQSNYTLGVFDECFSLLIEDFI